MSLAFTWGSTISSFCVCLFWFLFIFYTTALPPLYQPASPLSHCSLLLLITLFLPSHFSYMHTYLSAAATDVSANINETRRRKVGCDPEGLTEEEGDRMGDGWGRTDLGREWWSLVSLCVYVCVCLCKKPGGLTDIILPRTIQILPPKLSHHALLSVWEKLMHGHTETHTQMPK